MWYSCWTCHQLVWSPISAYQLVLIRAKMLIYWPGGGPEWMLSNRSHRKVRCVITCWWPVHFCSGTSDVCAYICESDQIGNSKFLAIGRCGFFASVWYKWTCLDVSNVNCNFGWLKPFGLMKSMELISISVKWWGKSGLWSNFTIVPSWKHLWDTKFSIQTL